MIALLGWIPILGPIIQGLFNFASGIYGKYKDTQLGMRVQDTEEEKVAAQIIHDTNDDICLRLLRDLYCTPAIIHLFAVTWDTMIAETTWVRHDLMWHVAAFPPSYAWYPTTVAVFLMGSIGFNIWKRK